MVTGTLTGFNSDKQLADELNSFYLRFDNRDFTDTVNSLKEITRKYLKHTNKRKSPGPDNICGNVLATCAGQLCNIFYLFFIFTVSSSVMETFHYCPSCKDFFEVFDLLVEKLILKFADNSVIVSVLDGDELP